MLVCATDFHARSPGRAVAHWLRCCCCR
uniref:Uncharacterized protein n=1 Tax=Arundo donax TaxID=35708 RepID=A0A0A9HJ94_ARUDO